MGKRNAAAAIVDADRLHQFETPPKRMKHSPAAAVAPTTDPVHVGASEFTLSKEFVDGTKLMDLTLKQWRIGKPIGKGSFGEIFLASDDIDKPVTTENAMYVVKIEPHSNGPLFVEIHCLLNTAKPSETCHLPPGMPEYIASGSHMFKNERYRFLILKRYERDLHSLIKNKRVNPGSIPLIACQILDVLEHLHDQGYVHSDIKAENLMVGKVIETAPFALRNGELAKSFANGHSGEVCHQRLNGSSPHEGGKAGKRGKKGSVTTEVESVCNGSGGHVPENGLYQHQEQEMGIRSRNLRPLKTVTYRDLSDEDDRGKMRSAGGAAVAGNKSALPQRRRGRKKQADTSFSCSISPRRSGYDELKAATEEAHWNERLQKQHLRAAGQHKTETGVDQKPAPEEDRIHLIDFGLASKFMDPSGQHRPFCMDQRRAHDGTLEFTSRDAHMGAHARRSDLECLGYNLVYWSRGFLPWKDEKLLNQPEQVHRMKEYFMADVREMLRLIYGDDCPAYLGDFLAYVAQLTYDERPDYQYCRSLFYKELKRLGYPVGRSNQPLQLDVDAIDRLSEPLTAQDEAEITNKINHVKSLMKLGALFPYRECTLHSKASSPKNLRSKRSDAHGRNSLAAALPKGPPGASTPVSPVSPPLSSIATRQKEKKFSAEDIFATDADQIARERAEKEFERAEQMEETVIRYTGRPTYAIQELERKMRSGGGGYNGAGGSGGLEYTESEGYIKGYTKPMMDILRKRQSQLFREIEEARTTGRNGAKEPKVSNSLVDQRGDVDEVDDDDDNEDEEDESVSAALEQDDEEEDDEEEEEVEEDNKEEEEEEEDADMVVTEKKLKVEKYYHDEDFDEQAEEEEVEEEEDEEDEAEVEDEETEEEAEEEEEDEELEDDQYEKDWAATSVARNGCYEKKGSKSRAKGQKGHKREDTDSDFCNDGGCEEEELEEDAENEEKGSEEEVGSEVQDEPGGGTVAGDDVDEDGNEDDLRDSDFNDQESTTSESDVVIPSKRRRKGAAGRGNERKRAAGNGKASKRAASAVERIRKASKFRETDVAAAGGVQGNEREYASVRFGKRTSSNADRPRKRHRIHDEDDNARQYEGHPGVTAAAQNGHAGPVEVTLAASHHHNNNNHCNSKAYYGDVDDSSHDTAPSNGLPMSCESKYRFVKRRKSGLRERIRPTDRGNDYQDNLQRKQKAALRNKRRRESAAHLGGKENGEPGAGSETLNDENSCSSIISSGSTSSSTSTGSISSSTGSSTSHSNASSSRSNRSARFSVVSAVPSSIASSRGRSVSQKPGKRGRKPAAGNTNTNIDANASSGDSSIRRRESSSKTAGSGKKFRREPITAPNEASQPRWSRATSNSSRSTATSRSSSVSAVAAVTGKTGPVFEDPATHVRLSSLPENDSFIGENDDDTRDVDYRPVCTRRKRKAMVTDELSSGRAHETATSRTLTSTTSIRKKIHSKGGNGKGIGPGASSSTVVTTSSASASLAAVVENGTANRLSGARAARREEPRPPVAVAIQQQRGRRYQQHQNNYRMEEQAAPLHHHHHHLHHQQPQHHHSPTMLVRTYSRG